MRGRKRKLPRDFVPAPWLSSSDNDEPPVQRVQRLQDQQQPHQVGRQQVELQQAHGGRQAQNNDEIFVESGNESFFEEPDNLNLEDLQHHGDQQHDGHPDLPKVHHVPQGAENQVIQEEEVDGDHGVNGNGNLLQDIHEEDDEFIPEADELEQQAEEDENLLGNFIINDFLTAN